jgi:hypothetical protein
MKRNMLLFILLITLVGLLSGCAGFTGIVEMDCPPMTAQRTILLTWVPVDDPVAKCKTMDSVTFADGGCISCLENTCMVWMEEPAKARDDVVGHEVKHGFGCKHI